jgi:gamma-butyrobetaine dioxygenase
VPEEPSIAAIIPSSDGLNVSWTSGERDDVPGIWLRDACSCEQCRDPHNDQHLIDVLALGDDVLVTATLEPGGLTVVFDTPSGGSHEGWVSQSALAGRLVVSMPTTWDCSHIDVLYDGAVDTSTTDELAPLLTAVDRYGIGLARAVATESGEVLNFAERIGFVRETNYGRLFDVVVEPDPVNLAYTPKALPLHTDNPYREPVPTIQLLHCLSSSPTGGGSRFADGFAAAERLRSDDPNAFEILSTYDVAFRFHDATTDLRARGSIIETSARGWVTGIRLNHRSMEPPDVSADALRSWYAAYRAFCMILAGEEAAIEITLQPGDLVVFDNRRVLHGRSAFAVTDRRHLQGCYADIDAVRSNVRLVEAS